MVNYRSFLNIHHVFLLSGLIYFVNQPTRANSKPDEFKGLIICNHGLYIPKYQNTKSHLTGFWHLEHTGADLAKRYMNTIPKERTHNVRVAIWDAGLHFQRPRGATRSCKNSLMTPTSYLNNLKNFSAALHGYSVASFLSGVHGPIDLNGRLDSIVDSSYNKGADDDANIGKLVGRGVQVLNISLGVDPEKIPNGDAEATSTFRASQALDNTGQIAVTGAGNWGNNFSELNFDKIDIPAIVVGSIDPHGYRSSFSTPSSKRSIIYAPGEHLAEKTFTGEYSFSAGTSMAAPQVSGVMAQAKRLLPEINRQIAEEVLWFTGLNGPPSSRDASPIKIMNAYKFIRVIERLAAILKRKNLKGAEAIRSTLLEEIKKPELYNFSIDVTKVMSKKYPDRRFPVDEATCRSLLEEINDIRAAFFLNPQKSLAERIANLYGDYGYEVNAQYFRNLAINLK